MQASTRDATGDADNDRDMARSHFAAVRNQIRYDPYTAARILLEVGDGSAFATAGHLAAYAGLAPVTRRSGTSIRGEHPSRAGNKHLKRAFFLSAFAALSDPTSRAYYDRKRAQGKRHNQALIALARRRTDVLYAMLRDGTLYEDPTTPPASSSVALAA